MYIVHLGWRERDAGDPEHKNSPLYGLVLSLDPAVMHTHAHTQTDTLLHMIHSATTCETRSEALDCLRLADLS